MKSNKHPRKTECFGAQQGKANMTEPSVSRLPWIFRVRMWALLAALGFGLILLSRLDVIPDSLAGVFVYMAMALIFSAAILGLYTSYRKARHL